MEELVLGFDHFFLNLENFEKLFPLVRRSSVTEGSTVEDSFIISLLSFFSLVLFTVEAFVEDEEFVVFLEDLGF